MKKLGLLVLAMVVAMGMAGIAYASWNQPLTISSTAQMATLSAQFVVVDASIPDPNGGPATCVVSLGTTTETNDTLVVTIAHAYPGYNAFLHFDIYNNGGIEANVTTGNIDVTGNGHFVGPSQLQTPDLWVTVNVPMNNIPVSNYLSNVAPNFPDLAIFVPANSVPIQGGTYTITIPLTVHQFNTP